MWYYHLVVGHNSDWSVSVQTLFYAYNKRILTFANPTSFSLLLSCNALAPTTIYSDHVFYRIRIIQWNLRRYEHNFVRAFTHYMHRQTWQWKHKGGCTICLKGKLVKLAPYVSPGQVVFNNQKASYLVIHRDVNRKMERQTANVYGLQLYCFRS